MNTSQISSLADRIANLPFATIDAITTEIAKRGKKKKVTSGNMFFSDFTKKVSELLLKESNREILKKYMSVHNEVFNGFKI